MCYLTNIHRIYWNHIHGMRAHKATLKRSKNAQKQKGRDYVRVLSNSRYYVVGIHTKQDVYKQIIPNKQTSDQTY